MHLQSSDHFGMNLVLIQLNGNNFLPWKRAVLIALGAKNKLDFVNDSNIRTFSSVRNSDMAKLNKFKIGLCQISVTADKRSNIDKACSMIESASKQGANLVVLPEMWNCPYSTEYFERFAENFEDEINAPTYKMLSRIASREGLTIIGGSIPEWCGGRLHNTCCVFGPNGKLLAKHRKIHMFDVDIPGDISFKESDIFLAGAEPTIVDTDVGRIGIGICHDIRFPELAMVYEARGADMICYPGAFNISTGEALWELEQKARLQIRVFVKLYVATCSPSRDSAGSYAIWGHSSLIDPLGRVIATSGHEETIVLAEVDYDATQCTRESLPILKQRRQDIYRFKVLY
ncbi:Omega-amidase-chloroplastic [Striga hermonthica]|uniref:Omega-amidase-chloroplastic n=1 Tax=Striga hermonthica TaxID=68872 RepID=A0A9N7R5L4_STRHE|nr:Omega-amidase-chloroplastic [Striga hermonthica]